MARHVVGTLIFGDQGPVSGGEIRLTALDNYEGATGVMRESTAVIPVDNSGHYGFDLELGGYKAEYAYADGEVVFLGLAQCDYGPDIDLLSLIAPFGHIPQPDDYAGIIAQLMAMLRGDVIIKTASFALDADKQNAIYVCDSTNLIEVTVPVGFPEGWYVTIIRRGTGEVNIVSDGVTIIEVAEPLLQSLRTQASPASLNKLDAETWLLAGDLTDSLP